MTPAPSRSLTGAHGMLLIARCGRRRWCRGRCWSYVRDEHPLLQSATLKNSDRRMIALAMYRIATLDLPSHTPCSVFPHLLTIRTYNVRGIRIVRCDVVAEMHILEKVRIIFLDGLPTVDRS